MYWKYVLTIKKKKQIGTRHTFVLLVYWKVFKIVVDLECICNAPPSDDYR
jgi:hypothetical protein